MCIFLIKKKEREGAAFATPSLLYLRQNESGDTYNVSLVVALYSVVPSRRGDQLLQQRVLGGFCSLQHQCGHNVKFVLITTIEGKTLNGGVSNGEGLKRTNCGAFGPGSPNAGDNARRWESYYATSDVTHSNAVRSQVNEGNVHGHTPTIEGIITITGTYKMSSLKIIV